MRHLPNLITLLRLLLLPLFVHAVFRGDRTLAVVLLAAISASDALDGWLARHYRAESRLGALFDPIVDKLVQVTALVLLVANVSPEFAPVPGWFLGLVLARDLLLLYGTLRIGRRHRKVIVRVRWEGRLSTFLIYVLVFGVLLGAGGALLPGTDISFACAVVLLATPVIVLAAVRYVLAGRAQLKAPSPDDDTAPAATRTGA